MIKSQKIKRLDILSCQVIALLLICRWQSFMVSIKLREVIDVNDSNIFLSIAISFLMSFIIYIPAKEMIKRFKCKNIIDITGELFPKLGSVISVIFGLYFLLVAMVHVTKTDLFMTTYIYLDASRFLIGWLILIAIYGVYLGYKSIARSGFVIFITFLILNLIVIIFLIPVYNRHYIGPIIMTDKGEIMKYCFSLMFYPEMIAFLVLVEKTKGKSDFTYRGYQTILFFMEVVIILVLTLTMGRYINTNVFPLYVLPTMIENSIMSRLNAIYTALDTMLSVIKTSLYFYLSYRCINGVIKERYKMLVVIIYGLVCLIGSVNLVFEVGILNEIISFVNSPILICGLFIILPSILCFVSKFREKRLKRIK